jgi:hypothetical protein
MSGVLSGSTCRVASGQDGNPAGSSQTVLELLLKETPRPNYDASVPSLISGRSLLHDREKKSGVKDESVTDGYPVVKTNAAGDYTLKQSTSSPKQLWIVPDTFIPSPTFILPP